MNHNFKDISTQVFGALTVVQYHDRDKHGQALWKCNCVCGKSCISSGAELRSGRKISCGCRASRVLPNNGALQNELFYRYKRMARSRGLSFDLEKDEFIGMALANCYYCNRIPYSDMESFLYNGIDRVDNEQGYTSSNCVTCCKECNHAKHTLTHDQFIEMCRMVVYVHGGLE